MMVDVDVCFLMIDVQSSVEYGLIWDQMKHIYILVIVFFNLSEICMLCLDQDLLGSGCI